MSRAEREYFLADHEGEFTLGRIPATKENAEIVQALTLQDLRAGGWPDATDLADPKDRRLVRAQRTRLRRSPSSYIGGFTTFGLDGYIKLGEWKPGDHIDFASEAEKSDIERQIQEQRVTMTKRTLGIFGLVTSEDLSDAVRFRMAYNFLHESIMAALDGPYERINIPVHDNDPARRAVQAENFHPVARGQATGARGIEQTLYQRVITGHEY